MQRIAVIGGGPGGLMTARCLERKTGAGCHVALFEASDRLGGKLQTRAFDSGAVRYEAGVAECYDYEAFGHDPLKHLVRTLGLTPMQTSGSALVLNGCILRDAHDIVRHCGQRTLDAIQDFQGFAAARVSRTQWVHAFGPEDHEHPCARQSCSDLLDAVPDASARRYLHVAMHSDMATEPHLTHGLIGLRNALKGVPGYGAQYTIAGGMEMLARALAAGLTKTQVHRSSPVVAIAGNDERGYVVRTQRSGRVESLPFDAVVVALPYSLLHGIEWKGDALRRAITSHVAHYDRPGHYLRVSLLFDRAFWRSKFSGSWVMLDAFGGCCVYDESDADGGDGPGVLGFLLAGTDALTRSNADDETLVAQALNALADALHHDASAHLVEGRVHRWVGSVSGIPGGWPLRSPRSAHRPEPLAHGRLAVVGDYLFDSTLNGVLRSAELSSSLVLERPRTSRWAFTSARALRWPTHDVSARGPQLRQHVG